MLIIKIVLGYVFLLFFLRIINNRYDYGNLITVIVVVNSIYLYIIENMRIIDSTIVILIILVTNYLINKYIINSKILLINDGKFNFTNNTNYSFSKVLEFLKKNNINDISVVDKLYIKNNRFILEKKKDMIIIIRDGKINYRGLKEIKKSYIWLKKSLKDNNVLLENILLAFFKNNKTYFIKRN